MNKALFKFILICASSFLLLQNCIYRATCQTNEIDIDATKKYDEILNKNEVMEVQLTPETETKQEPIPEQTIEIVNEKSIGEINELTRLLPKLDATLYKDWGRSGDPLIWMTGDSTLPPVTQKNELLAELGIESILKQSYKKENHKVDTIVYKFKEFAGAYSAYSILHQGATTKLKVGRNASESESLINFWKENYYIDIHTNEQNDSVAKEFVILSSQDVSKNIEKEQPPPVIAIQLPALNRVQGTEKYCLGLVCCNEYIKKEILNFDCSLLDLQNSGGVIIAEYQLAEDKKDKERITLILVRYLNKDIAELVFNAFKSNFENKRKEKKEIDIEIDDSVIVVKINKNDYIILKQKGNLLGIAYNITNKKSGEQVLELVPWPIEIYKPTGNSTPDVKSSQQESQ